MNDKVMRYISLTGLFVLVSFAASAQSVSMVSGNGQVICSLCPTEINQFDPLVVLVKDSRGNPAPNVTVTWTIASPGGINGQVQSATTLTAADGTSSNTIFISPPLTLLTAYVQSTVTANALGSSVTFTETNGAVATGQSGIALVVAGLSGPPSGTVFTGPAGSVSSIPIQVAVGTFSPGGPVPGVDVRVVSDPTLPASAACVTSPGNQPGSVMTDSTGKATCNLQFGSTTGQGQIRVYVGDKYSVFSPFTIQVTSASAPPPNPTAQLTVNPASLSFQYPGNVTNQNVLVGATTGSITYTASVEVTLARVDWLMVGAPSAPATSTSLSSLPISVHAQGLPNGVYNAVVDLHPNNGSADVALPVQLTVNTAAPPPAPTAALTVNPTALSFQSSGPSSQTVNVFTTGSAVTYTAAVQITLAAVTWLSVGQPSGPVSSSTPSSFPVYVNTNNLTPGTWRAVIDVHPNNGTADILIPVQFTVGGATPPTTSTLSLAPGSLIFQYPGGTLSQPVTVSSSSGSVNYTATVQAANPPATWLSAGAPTGPATSGTTSQFTVSVSPQSLQAGNYSAYLVVHPTNGSADIPVPVQLTVTSSAVTNTLVISPGSLNVGITAGDGSFAAGPLTIGSSTPGLQFVAAPSGASWLGLATSSITTPAQVTLFINTAGLAPGNYSGNVTVAAPAASNSPMSVPVTLTVQAQQQNLTISTSALNFTAQAGSPPPAAQKVSAAVNNGTLPYTAVAAVTSPPGGTWLSVSPTAGTLGGSPINLLVSADPSHLAPGTYTGTVTLSSAGASNGPQTVNITFTVSAAATPTPLPLVIHNGASGLPGPISPGEILAITGNFLGPATEVDGVAFNGFIPTLVSDTQVTFDNLPAPILHTSATEIDVAVPYEIAGRATTMLVVTYKNTSSAPLNLNVAASAPGISVNAAGQALIANADGSMNTPDNPATAEDTITINGTGEGATSPAGVTGLVIPADGSVSTTPVLPVVVTIGGMPAQVVSSGSVPGQVSGTFQVSVVVPDGVPTGAAVPVTLQVGSATSQTVTMAIQ